MDKGHGEKTHTQGRKCTQAFFNIYNSYFIFLQERKDKE